MAQHDQVLADQAGLSFRADVNGALAALFSNNSGATEPSVMVAYQWWADITSGWLKQRNAANNAWVNKIPLADAMSSIGRALFSAASASDARSSLGLGALATYASVEAAMASQITHRNKVIGHFDQNQRGLTSVGDDAYCLDRWYVLTESGNVTVAQISDPEAGAPWAIKLTQPDASPKRMGLATIIEAKNVKQFRNAAMNFFMRVKPSFGGNVRYAILEHTGTADTVTSDVVNNWASATFTPSNFFIAGVNVIKTGTIAPGAATYGEFSDYGVMGASLNNAILFVWTESAQAQNATLELNRPQFEPGIVHTPHEWRMNELALCQRYYQILGESTSSLIVSGQATAGAQEFNATYAYMAQMRSSPTATVVGTWSTANASTSAPTLVGAAGVGSVIVAISSSAAGRVFAYNSNAGNQITLSSEL